MATSKTARASAVKAQAGDTKVIPDAELIRLLRIEVASRIYPSSQGTHALLREYDLALVALEESRRALRGAVDLAASLQKTIDATVAGVNTLAVNLPEIIAEVAPPEVQS